MSDWHRRMQNYFSKEYQEVVVSHKGITHRADVIIGDIVIEFQNSPLSAEEFYERNKFYTECGYRVAWVINLIEPYNEERLYHQRINDSDRYMKWNYPKKFLEHGPLPQNKKSKISIWISIDDDPEVEGFISRVIWSSQDYDIPNYKVIKLSANEIDLSSKFVPQELFYWKNDWVKYYLKNLPSYSTKVAWKKGCPKVQYICPKSNIFGLKVWGDGGCKYCNHCGVIVENNYKKRSFDIYCCYPNTLEDGPYEIDD